MHKDPSKSRSSYKRSWGSLRDVNVSAYIYTCIDITFLSVKVTKQINVNLILFFLFFILCEFMVCSTLIMKANAMILHTLRHTRSVNFKYVNSCLIGRFFVFRNSFIKTKYCLCFLEMLHV